MDAEEREAIKDLFDRIYETDALIVKPALGWELARCQEDLHKIGAPELPADYIEFLEIANGISWNGFEFFGTYQVTVKKSGYTLNDIVSANTDWHGRKMGLKGLLVLGRFDDDLYVYHSGNHGYLAVDSLSLAPIDRFRSFSELFLNSVGPYADYEDDGYPPDDEDASLEEGE